MKNLTKAIPALALATLIISGPAAASVGASGVPTTDINIHSVSTASVMVSVHDGVATLTGTVDGVYEKSTLENAVMKLEGVVEVKNFLSY